MSEAKITESDDILVSALPRHAISSRQRRARWGGGEDVSGYNDITSWRNLYCRGA
jgi:hypothetical protein